MAPTDYISTADAAQALGVSLRRVQQLVTAGRLPATMVSGVYLIRRGDLKLVAHRKPGRPWPKKGRG
jgi:excisionase family DNA binding protein